MATTVTPSKTTRFLNETQRQAIIAEVASGRKQVDVAQAFNVHPNTVNSLVRAVRTAGTQAFSADWRTKQTTNAITAVDCGLTHDADPYRRADLGVKVLTGLGVYKSDTSSTTVNIFANVQDLPRDWYEANELISGTEAALDVDSKVIDDTETQHD